MASRSYLLCLALILMSVFASARRPPVIDNIEAELQAPPKGPDGGDVSQNINVEASEALPSPLSTGGGGKKKISEASQTDVSRGIYDEASEPLPPLNYGVSGKKKISEASQTDVSRGIYDEASVPLPSPLSNGVGGKKKIVEASQTDVTRSINDKTEDRNGRLSTQPRSLAVGLIPIIPGGDGSFHFTLGPIDFGGDIGLGGFTPGYSYYQPQPQPYVVVSPYTSQYPIVPPYAPFGSGYGQAQPSQGYSGPYPYARGYAPGSSQTGGSASNQHN